MRPIYSRRTWKMWDVIRIVCIFLIRMRLKVVDETATCVLMKSIASVGNNYLFEDSTNTNTSYFRIH